MRIPTSYINIAKAQLTKVINCQLDRMNLFQSNKEGVMRLIPKPNTERGVVPWVDQLHLFVCTDYNLLTMIISNRLVMVLHEVVTSSGQLCSMKENGL